MCLSLISLHGVGSNPPHSPPLAILILAAITEAAGFNADIVDIQALALQGRLNPPDRNFLQETASRICETHNRYLCFTSRCDTYPYIIDLARRCKRMSRDCTIILGGPQATSTDVLTLETFPWIDIVVRGEGEATFPQLIHLLMGGQTLTELKGITFRNHEGRVIRNPNMPLLDNLDAISLPAYEKYEKLYGDIRPVYGDIEIGRGCPFSCSFCFTSRMWEHSYRLKSVDSMIRHIRYLQDHYHINQFRFIHDNVIFKRSPYWEKFFAVFSHHIPAIQWSASTRIDCLDIDLLPDLRLSGCADLFFGIESGGERIQRSLNKNFSLARVKEVLKACSENNINATLSFIVGFPSEKREDIEETVRFALDCTPYENVKCIQFHALAPVTGTPLYEELRNQISYSGTYSNHNGDRFIREAIVVALIKKYKDIFSSFYAINSPHFPLDLPFAVQEVLGCLINFFPMTIMVATHQLSTGILDFLDGLIQEFYVGQIAKWKYGKLPRVNMRRIIKKFYGEKGQDSEAALALCTFENRLYTLSSQAQKPSDEELSVQPGQHNNITEVILYLSRRARLLAHQVEPYTLFSKMQEDNFAVRALSSYGAIPKSFILCHFRADMNGYTVRKIAKLEYDTLRLLNGNRSVGQVLDLLEKNKGFFRSNILRNNFERFFKQLLKENIVVLAIKQSFGSVGA